MGFLLLRNPTGCVSARAAAGLEVQKLRKNTTNDADQEPDHNRRRTNSRENPEPAPNGATVCWREEAILQGRNSGCLAI
jgi:hypothetical protein